MNLCHPATITGARFSRAGVVAQATLHGRTFFGPWQAETPPPDAHDAVTGTAGEFGMGINGMPAPLGYDDAAPGGTFVKIGVGVLRRPDAAPYSFAGAYEIVDVPPWEIDVAPTSITMRQSLRHGGWGYRYTYTLALHGSSFVTSHLLENTGDRPIDQAHYAHNFFVFDGQPIGQGCVVCFPFTPVPRRQPPETVLDGRCLRFTTPVLSVPAIFTELDGFGDTVADNGVEIIHEPAGMAVRITGDRPLTRCHVFATPRTICPEPFVALAAAPGDSIAWQHRYDLLERTLP
jgi:hypothetical protein